MGLLLSSSRLSELVRPSFFSEIIVIWIEIGRSALVLLYSRTCNIIVIGMIIKKHSFIDLTTRLNCPEDSDRRTTPDPTDCSRYSRKKIEKSTVSKFEGQLFSKHAKTKPKI